MERIIVVHGDSNQYSAKKENIFIALDRQGVYLGSLYIYPYFAYDTEPEHPHNLYLHLHMHSETGNELIDSVKDKLLENALKRAVEIKNEAQQAKTRVYACFTKHQQDEIAYFLQRGFSHDEGMVILERIGCATLPQVDVPDEVTIQPWEMETAAEQRQFIKTHQSIFPRHQYCIERLQELKGLPGWHNYTAFSHTEIAGNIMMYNKPDSNSVGYIEDLFVLKKWRRRGIGKYLLTAALTHFQNTGIHRIQLEHWSANKPAFQLYRAFGFLQIDETEIAVGRYV
jgi:ribosomal protein S18 acetylase RimI-like enzyme